MKDIQLEIPAEYTDEKRFLSVGNGVYRDLTDTDSSCYRVALSFTSEEDEGQYPLEDVLDEYLVHVDSEIEMIAEPWATGTRVMVALAGELSGIRDATQLAGKRAYNQTRTENGREFVHLVIE